MGCTREEKDGDMRVRLAHDGKIDVEICLPGPVSCILRWATVSQVEYLSEEIHLSTIHQYCMSRFNLVSEIVGLNFTGLRLHHKDHLDYQMSAEEAVQERVFPEQRHLQATLTKSRS